jgi:hypothetical protein
MIAWLLLVVTGILGFLCVSTSFGDSPKSSRVQNSREISPIARERAEAIRRKSR